MRRVGHVAGKGCRRGACRVLMGRPKGKTLLERLDVDRNAILK
jgi:hypothetical protein